MVRINRMLIPGVQVPGCIDFESGWGLQGGADDAREGNDFANRLRRCQGGWIHLCNSN